MLRSLAGKQRWADPVPLPACAVGVDQSAEASVVGRQWFSWSPEDAGYTAADHFRYAVAPALTVYTAKVRQSGTAARQSGSRANFCNGSAMHRVTASAYRVHPRHAVHFHRSPHCRQRTRSQMAAFCRLVPIGFA